MLIIFLLLKTVTCFIERWNFNKLLDLWEEVKINKLNLKVRCTQYGFHGQAAFKNTFVGQGRQPSQAGLAKALILFWGDVSD